MISQAHAVYTWSRPGMSEPLRQRLLIIIMAIVLAAGCSRQDERLQQHRENFVSLGSSAAAIGEAWLAGSTSGTYTSTALQQTFMLVEQERHALGSRPGQLLDPRGAELSQASERLSRLIASMMQDIRAADSASLRQHLKEIPAAAPHTQ